MSISWPNIRIFKWNLTVLKAIHIYVQCFKLQQNSSNRTKVTSLLVRPPTVFWRFKNATQQKVTKTQSYYSGQYLGQKRNIQMKFYRLKDNSYLHMMARFRQNISNRIKVMALSRRPPLIFWRFKDITPQKVAKTRFY